VPVLVREPVRAGWQELSRAAGDSAAVKKACFKAGVKAGLEAGAPEEAGHATADGYVP
jgi:hypothetical protein